MEFAFLYPQYLFLLFLIPLFFIIHFYSLNYRRKIALKFANFDAIAKIQGVDFFSKNVILLVLSCFIVFSLILAISGLTIHTIRESSSFSFVLAIDSSMSMSANDLVPDRITAAKETAKVFVDSSGVGTRIGIISFSGFSLIESDLIEDKGLLKTAIDRIETQNYGGTDLHEAIINAINLLDGEDSKAVVVLSDGQTNVGKIEDTIYYANKNNIMIHTIAMGTSKGGLAGGALTKLDEDTLKAISYNTGGIYFSAETNEDLSKAFSDILNLTEKKVAIKMFNYLILFAIGLFILVFFLSNTKYLNLP